MNNTREWVYMDSVKNIWKFELNENSNLVYKVMYDEEKWTKERMVAEDVVKYSIYIEDEIIHIIYINEKNEIKYCIFKNKQWLGKPIYNIDTNSTIVDLKTLIFQGKMHIFYLLKVNDDIDHGILMDFIWNGKEINLNTIEHVILKVNIQEYFRVQSNDDNLEVYFITDQGDGAALKISTFKNDGWTTPKWLYCIQGDKIEFEVMRNSRGRNLVNKSMEKNKYLLEHVFIDANGNMKNYIVLESTNEIIELILFNNNNRLYASWLKNGEISYSEFANEKWSEAKKANINAECKIKTCYAAIFQGDYHINPIKTYCISEPKFQILFQSEFIESDDEDFNNSYEINEKTQRKLMEISEANKKLEKEINFINMQLEKKNRLIEEYEKSYNGKLRKKNNDLFLEVQKSIQKELDRIKNQLIEEKTITSSLQNKLKENEDKYNMLNKQIELLNEENKKLQEELEMERNQTIFKRILRKKSSDI
jgi:hypothetical protein